MRTYMGVSRGRLRGADSKGHLAGFIRVVGLQVGPGVRLVWGWPETPALIVGPANELSTHGSWALFPPPHTLQAAILMATGAGGQRVPGGTPSCPHLA